MGITLRWFQQLGLVRQLEHRADGSLCWRYVVESTPRRVGKSVRLKVTACWRVDHAELLGEPQTVLFTGKDLPICKEIHRSAWSWAQARSWKVYRGMGNEEIEKPDGSRWLVRSQGGVYGYPAGLAACDESWKVPDAVIREGLQPAMMNRANPQMLLTSTAHTGATSLMRRRIRSGLDTLDGSGDSLLLLWCAAPDADPGDPVAWREASPYWDADRAQLTADAWSHVVAGQVVPDPDEPDPVAGFKAQYLNLWPVDELAGVVWLPADEVAACGRLSVVPAGRVAAVEQRPDSESCSAVFGGVLGAEVVLGRRLDDVDAWLRARAPEVVLCHQAVANRLSADLPVRVVKSAEAAAGVSTLAEVVRARGLVFDQPDGVAAQFAHVVVVPTEQGARIAAQRSRGDVSVVKALSWLVWWERHAAVEGPAVF
jgi:hypothetical protein